MAAAQWRWAQRFPADSQVTQAQPLLRCDPAFTESVQNHRAADGKAAYGPQGKGLCDLCAQMQQIAGERGNRTENSQNIQPHRRAHGIGLPVIAEAELQQDRDQSYSTQHHDGQRAEECPPSSKQHDQGDTTAKQSGSDHGPAARWGWRIGQFVLRYECLIVDRVRARLRVANATQAGRGRRGGLIG